MYYRLEGHQPVKVDIEGLEKWLLDPEKEINSVVAQDTVGETLVSTVFLSVDHSSGFGEPQLFETAVFENARPRDIQRYPTWTAAEAGHQKILEKERENHGKQTTKPTSEAYPSIN